MSNENKAVDGTPGTQLAREILNIVDDRHDGQARRTVNGLLGSIFRICRRARGMVARDDRWQVREGAGAEDYLKVVFGSVRDCEVEYQRWRGDRDDGRPDVNPHVVGMLAEQLLAKSLATFGGREAVEDICKWTERADASLARRVPGEKA